MCHKNYKSYTLHKNVEIQYLNEEETQHYENEIKETGMQLLLVAKEIYASINVACTCLQNIKFEILSSKSNLKLNSRAISSYFSCKL